MDGIWLKVSNQLVDLGHLKDRVRERITRQWKIIQMKILEDLPRQAVQLFIVRSHAIQHRLFNAIDGMNTRLEKRWAFIKLNSSHFTDTTSQFLQNRWQQLQPRLDSLVTTSFAISTATSTLQLTVQVTPILLSALTIMATAPMLNALLPEFLFNSTVLFFIMMAISAYAGYSKFKELETRAKLDGQIEIDEREIKKQAKQIEELTKRLKVLEQVISPFEGSQPNYLPLSQKERQSLTKSAPANSSPSLAPELARQDSSLKR